MDKDRSVSSPNCYQIITLPFDPYLKITFDDGKPVFEGVMLTVINEIFAAKNLCYNLNYAGNIGYGQYLRENNTYTGMLGEVYKGNYDFIIHPMGYTDDRYHNFSPAAIVGNMLWAIVYRYPRIEPDLSGFIKPFHFQSWILIAASLMLAAGILSAIYLLERSLKTDSRRTTRAEKIKDAIIDSIRVLLMQSFRMKPKLSGGYFAMSVWILTSMIISISYRSSLKALLILPKVNVPFSSLRELVEQNEYGWITPKGTLFNQVIMESPKGSLYRKFYDGMSYLYVSTEEAFDAIDNKKLAVVTVKLEAFDYIDTGFSQEGYCTRTIAPDNFFPMIIGMILKKNSSLSTIINRGITAYKESGILDHHIQNAVRNASQCIGNLGKPNKNDLRPLAIGDFFGIFSLLGGGYILATLTFLIEFCNHRISSQKKNITSSVSISNSN